MDLSGVQTALADPSAVTEDEDPIAEAEKREQIAKVLEALPGLSAWQREVISLRFGAGLHLAEAADVMGKSLGAVKTPQHQAIRKLRRLLGPKA